MSTKVVYLDQNFLFCLAERADQERRFGEARDAVVAAVDSHRAIFPDSQMHLSESENMSPESKLRIGDFSDRISRGYRFTAGKEIRSSQFLDVFNGKQIRLSSASRTFAEQIGSSEAKSEARRHFTVGNPVNGIVHCLRLPFGSFNCAGNGTESLIA